MLGLVPGSMEGAARTTLIPAPANLSPGQVFVVGDTPCDVEAAQAVGAVSVGMASGHESTAELAAAGPDHVPGSLEESFPGL